jgi:hypothetical protein
LQSISVMQPQTPPARHWSPFEPLQSAQDAPSEPHALGSTPDLQRVPSQQPPLHCPAPVQLVVHACALQAYPAGQSVDALHPQAPATQ